MTTPEFDKFWQGIAAKEETTGRTFQVRARFSADKHAESLVTIILEDGEPFVVVDDMVTRLRERLEPSNVLANISPSNVSRWSQAFEAIADAKRLTLNQACRLILGPTYRPERGSHAYNANWELFVRAEGLSEWVTDLPADGREYRLVELYGERVDDGSAREDANAVALRAIRTIVEACHDFEFQLAERRVRVVVAQQASEAWPRDLAGLDEESDGPWPPSVVLQVDWGDGSTELLLKTKAWNNNKLHGDSCGITVLEGSQELLWITVPASVKYEPDDTEVRVPATVTIFRNREPLGPNSNAGSMAIVGHLKQVGVPFKTKLSAEAFTIALPSGEVGPSSEEAFERLVKIALAKQPFMSDGARVYDPLEAAESLEELQGEKGAAILPLPGGVRSYKETLDKLLDWVGEEKKPLEELKQFFRDEYDITGKTALGGYVQMPRSLGVLTLESGALSLTEAGRAYRAIKTVDELFRLLHQAYVGVLVTLVVVDSVGGTTATITRLVCRVLGVDWKSANQVNFRRNWLLSLGLLERDDEGDRVSPAGKAVLAEYLDEVEELRAAIDKLLGEEEVDGTGDDGGDDAGSTIYPPKEDSGEPPGWGSERVNLRAADIQPLLAGLVLPDGLLAQAAAALSAGKHLLLVGPPGTGKTEFAQALAGAAQSEGYCAGLFCSTASADWTTYETVGGYALRKDGSLSFRPGVFLNALEQWKWLLIDELNRADIDKAFGELMTVLSGKAAHTPFINDAGTLVSIGPEDECMHVMPGTFRVIATMNIWDKTSLFRLSYAAQRRFAIIHVGLPEPAVYEKLLSREAQKDWIEPALPNAVTARLVELFSFKSILALRDVGPAIPLDMIRYMRTRKAEYVGMAEAIAMYLLPQLEGVEPSEAERLWGLLSAALGGDHAAERYLRARFLELFPLARLNSP